MPKAFVNVLAPVASVLLAFIGGCSGPSIAPVVGTVQLNGQPLSDATLVFEPIGDDSGNAAGSPSYGKTDSNGRYELRCSLDDQLGAAIGNHRVRIMTSRRLPYTDAQRKQAREALEKQSAETGQSGDIVVSDLQIEAHLSDLLPQITKEFLPARYNESTELTFEVKPSMDNVADFLLTVP